jgi:hypothetical protein
VAGILRGFVDCIRLRPRTLPASRYCFCSAVLLSFVTHLLRGRCLATVVCLEADTFLRLERLQQASTRDETQSMITADYDMAA